MNCAKCTFGSMDLLSSGLYVRDLAEEGDTLCCTEILTLQSSLSFRAK